MQKIKVTTYREVANPDGKIKLPLDIEITLPAEKLSRNGHTWTDVSQGVAASNRAIARQVPVLYMYLGHPCWDDPVVTGMLPAARLTNLIENADTTVTFYATMEYGSDTLPCRPGLWVGAALAAEVDIDCSIRAAADWKWGGDGVDQLEIPEGDFPLVIDFLPPDQQPGIPGTKVTNILSWKSEAANQIKSKFQESAVFKQLIDEITQEITNQIKQELRTKAEAGADTARGRKDTTMSAPIVKTEGMSADILKQIEELPDKESIVIFIKGMLAAMGVEDDAAVDDMGKMDEEPQESDYKDDEASAESFTRARVLWKAKAEPRIKLALEKLATLAVAPVQKETATAPPVAQQPTPVPVPTPAPAATAPVKVEAAPATITPQPATPAPAVAVKEEKQMSADDLEIQDIIRERREAREASKRVTTLTEAKNKAIKEKKLFYGHEIWDENRYPQVLLDKAIADGAKCVAENDRQNFFPERLHSIQLEAKLENIKQNAQRLPGNQYLLGGVVETEGWAGEENPVMEIAEKAVINPFLKYLKEKRPTEYAQYEANKGNEAIKLSVGETRQMYARSYKEDYEVNTTANNGNYAALMAGLGVVNKWIPSPIMQLAQNGPQLNMALGRVSGGGNMPMGQYIEIWSSSSDQPMDYDLGQKQLESDGLRQIKVSSQPFQYFAQFREIEIIWGKSTLFWLNNDPLKRNLDMESVYYLNQQINKETELIITAENSRSNLAYGATALTNETVNFAQADHFKVFSVGEDRVVEGRTISNMIGYFKLRRGQASGTVTLTLGPIVPPGLNPFLERSTEEDQDTHPVTLAAIGGKTQVRGKYDRVKQKGVRLNEGHGPEPTFLVLHEVGIVVMLEGSNFDGVNATVVSQYTPSSNVTRFDCALSGSETHQIKGNQLAELIIRMIAELRGLRQVSVEDIDYLLGPALILEGQLALASHFQGQNKLDYASIGPGMMANAQYLEILRRLKVMGTTDPYYAYNRLLTIGMSKTIVHREYAPPILGPVLTNGKINADGKLVRTHEQAQSITLRHITCTVPPARDPDTGKPENFGAATVYIVNPPASTGLPA